MRTLLIDNYDSFTYNLFQLLAQVNGRPPVVIRNDDRDAWRRMSPGDFDGVVLSPGPGHPAREHDFGLCRDAIRDWDLPMLGVCLGHQGLCHAFGGLVDRAPEPVHGRLSRVHHRAAELFAGLPTPFAAVRYHSLAVRELPPDVEATAWTDDGVIMAVRHAARPLWGVQFHPESIATEHGARLLANFRDLATRGRADERPGVPAPRRAAQHPRRTAYDLRVRALPSTVDPERALAALLDGDNRYWLDSSLARPGLARFSVVGGAGPLGELVTYDVRAQRVTVRRAGITRHHDERLWTYLDRELRRRHVPGTGLPFAFNLGYVGYLGYELKGDCGAEAPHRSAEPDAMLLFTDRAVVLDHETGRCWALALSTPETAAEAAGWLDRAAAFAARPGRAAGPVPDRAADDGPRRTTDDRLGPTTDDRLSRTAGGEPAGRLRHGVDEYLRLIAACQREIAAGESYEICLTNMITYPVRVDPVPLYRSLRALSPAPYAAFLRFAGFAVLSSSPERFIGVAGDGMVESKPIKGTRRRGATPDDDRRCRLDLLGSEKDRAENLMIVDLVRNDLGRVCALGSVHVPALFGVESYATVHQLVSTVRGRLADGRSPVDAVRAAFPGGSMTGAPKLRTMQILDRLEAGPRGVYSGAIGYFALGGAVDLAMVIRTMVVHPDRVTMGVGGAVTALSDPADEVAEMLLKAQAMRTALARAGVRAAVDDRDLVAPGPPRGAQSIGPR